MIFRPLRSMVGGTLALAATFLSFNAHAYCQTVSKNPPPGWNLETQGCFNGDGTKLLYWKKACVGYSLQKNASRQVTLGQATAITAAAFQSWNDVTCDGGASATIAAVDMGPVECGEVRYNTKNANQNVIVFRDDSWPYSDPNNTLGLTTVSFDTATGELVGADMEINSTLKLNVGNALTIGDEGEEGYDLKTILTHEAGHFLGLAHTPVQSAVMFASYQADVFLGADDSAGLCTIYPPSGTRSTTSGGVAAGACDPTPQHGFSGECEAPATDGKNDTSGGGGCALRGLPASGGALGGFGLMAMGAGVSMWRRGRQKGRGQAALLTGVMAALIALLTVAPSQASVSIAILFDELVGRSTAAAIVTPVEREGVWENGRIVTYTHVRVERVLAGNAPSDAWVRTLGGEVGRVGQLVEGEATLDVNKPALVFLQSAGTRAARADALEVTARGQGSFAIATVDQVERVVPTATGALLPPPASRIRNGARFAAQVLNGKTVAEATREVASVWGALHR